MIEGLKSESFKEYVDTLNTIRDSLDEAKDVEIETEDFRQICGIYHLYTWKHKDIIEVQENIMDLLMKHKERIDVDSIAALGTYTLGYLDGKYDPSGFRYLFASCEMGALVECEKIEEILRQDFPEDADVFKKYRDILETIEGACHIAYWILRKIANQHLKTLYYITLQIEPIFKSYVLHALDEFVGDEKVIKFYNDYIKFFEKIKNNSDKEEVHKECDALIKEANEYLEKVQK